MPKVIASSTYDVEREKVLMNLRPLRKFKSPVELLAAIRCAIEGDSSSYLSNLIKLTFSLFQKHTDKSCTGNIESTEISLPTLSGS